MAKRQNTVQFVCFCLNTPKSLALEWTCEPKKPHKRNDWKQIIGRREKYTSFIHSNYSELSNVVFNMYFSLWIRQKFTVFEHAHTASQYTRTNTPSHNVLEIKTLLFCRVACWFLCWWLLLMLKWQIENDRNGPFSALLYFMLYTVCVDLHGTIAAAIIQHNIGIFHVNENVSFVTFIIVYWHSGHSSDVKLSLCV